MVPPSGGVVVWGPLLGPRKKSALGCTVHGAELAQPAARPQTCLLAAPPPGAACSATPRSSSAMQGPMPGAPPRSTPPLLLHACAWTAQCAQHPPAPPSRARNSAMCLIAFSSGWAEGLVSAGHPTFGGGGGWVAGEVRGGSRRRTLKAWRTQTCQGCQAVASCSDQDSRTRPKHPLHMPFRPTASVFN